MGCLGGAGIDGQFHKDAEDENGKSIIRTYIEDNFPEITPNVRCPTGDAKWVPWKATDKIPARKGICQAVGPNFNGVDKANWKKYDQELKNTYKSVLKHAEENKAKTVGLCLISAGVFRGDHSLEEIIDLAYEAVKEGDYKGLEKVYLIGYSKSEVNALQKVFEDKRSQEK